MLFAPQNTHYRYPYNFFAYPLHSLNFRNTTLWLAFLFKWFLSSLMSGPAPSVQPFPCGRDTAQGTAGRWQLSQHWTLHCPGAKRLSWEQTARDISQHSAVPKSRCAKSWNHDLSSWKLISQAKLWKSAQISQYLTSQKKNGEQRLNIFFCNILPRFFHRIWPACIKYFVTVVIDHTVVPNPVSVGRIEKAQPPSRQHVLMPFLAPFTKGRSYFALWIPKLMNSHGRQSVRIC